MDASQYPVTTPYGYVAGYPLHNGFHQGIDYGCPVGTPVVVNNIIIGLSGNTGYTFGPHLHLGKWLNGLVQNPLNGGFNFKSAIVTEINEDADNGKYVRIQGDGFSWVYLHLSDNKRVNVGQSLQGGNMSANPTGAEAHAVVLAFETEADGITPHQPTQADLDFGVSTPWNDYIPNFYPMVQVLRDKIKLLTDDRDSHLYPYINAVTAALGLPVSATADDCVAAINALKKGSVSSVVINGEQYVPKKG